MKNYWKGIRKDVFESIFWAIIIMLWVLILIKIIEPHLRWEVITTEQIEQEELQEYEEERIKVGEEIADQLENTDYILPVIK